MDAFIRKVEEYIEKHQLLPAETLVVGVSGGADSMALLFVLDKIVKERYPETNLIVAHVHHGIRGKEADEDQARVEAFCREREISLKCRRLNIPAIAKEEKISLETAGRIQRYAFFSELCGENGRIAVAHHKEDQAESIAMHIFRGSGLDGICGIRPQNGNVIHPFLCVHKEEILAFCREQGIPFGEDSTNADPSYTRNFWREEVFPVLDRGLMQSPVEALCNLGERVSEETEYLDELAKEQLQTLLGDDGQVNAEDLSRLPNPIQRRVLRLIAIETLGDVVDLEACHWEEMMRLLKKKDGPKYVYLPKDRYFAIEQGKVHFLSGKDAFSMPSGGYISGAGFCTAEEDREVVIPLRDLPLGEMVKFSQSFLQMRLVSIEKEAELGYNNSLWFFPHSLLENAVLRTRREGDTVCRAGSPITKELRRYMNEVHLPERWRDRVLLVAQGDKILWIPGMLHAVGFTDAVSREKFIKDNHEKVYCLELFSDRPERTNAYGTSIPGSGKP
ncbi:MAG: tRNA lysidine(34) synthetase TilS [Clostridiales bacterium]|nr:tRNA lysidine(34) synthetase TilS [Clostridiales bacterium]